MMEPWELVLHRDAARAFFNSRGRDRQRLEKAFDSLTSDPTQQFDAVIKDATGRDNRIIYSGRWGIVFWLDEYVKEVRVVSLERVDA